MDVQLLTELLNEIQFLKEEFVPPRTEENGYDPPKVVSIRLLSVSDIRHVPNVQVSNLLGMFPDQSPSVADRRDAMYPYRAEVVYNGVVFFELWSPDEYSRHAGIDETRVRPCPHQSALILSTNCQAEGL